MELPSVPIHSVWTDCVATWMRLPAVLPVYLFASLSVYSDHEGAPRHSGAAEGRYRPLNYRHFTGMRASELRGLTWADVDLDKAKIHVRQRADKYHVIGMPKSGVGQRTTPLTPGSEYALRMALGLSHG